MTRGRKTGGKDFKKGTPKPEKSGRKKDPPALIELKKRLKTPDYRNIMADCWQADYDTLEIIVQDRSLPSGLLLISAVLKKAIDHHSFDQMVWFYDRMNDTNTTLPGHTPAGAFYINNEFKKELADMAMKARIEKIEEDSKKMERLDDAITE
jgi:hypothetical protein